MDQQYWVCDNTLSMAIRPKEKVFKLPNRKSKRLMAKTSRMSWTMIGPGVWQSGNYTAIQGKNIRAGWSLSYKSEKICDATSLKKAKDLAEGHFNGVVAPGYVG